MGKITRRDFVIGSLVVAGASSLPFATGSPGVMAGPESDYYPPARQGLRGSHPGSYEAAHQRARQGRTDWGPTQNQEEIYDLVVVGGGLSGLAGAFFFQQRHGTDKKILVLENHDDFGGHAKRNEHEIDGRLLIGQGGSESFETPRGFSSVMRNMLDDLGVDWDGFRPSYDTDFYRRHGLGAVTFFNRGTFGEDKLVRHPFCDYPGFVEGLLRPTLSYEQAVKQTPLNPRAQGQLLRVLNSGQQDLGVEKSEMRAFANRIGYLDFLRNNLGVDEPTVLAMARGTGMDYAGTATDAMSLGEALTTGVLGGDPYDNWSDVLAPGDYQEYINKDGGTYSVEYPFIDHYPDGNATIARSLVKKLVPAVGHGNNPQEIVTSRFNYAELDKPGNSTRIRLNSTVIKVEHRGRVGDADEVNVNYIRAGQAHTVRARGVVMAGYNMMIPHIVPGLPPEQDAALRALSKVPLQYTTVGLRNWRGVKEAGIGMAICPGNIHQVAGMDYPVSVGNYRFTRGPDDPCVLHMRSCPLGDSVGAPRIVQAKEARHRMLKMQFRDYEAELRDHLGGMLPHTHFDFDRDVASITINRWAHAYIIGNPGEVGRQRFGRITIANSDASGSALMQTAVEQAWRAVRELDQA